MSNDKTIVDEVRAALERDPRLPHPMEVAVLEQGGTVTLRGSVGSFHQRHAAVQIARSVRRVRGVEDELSLDLRDHWEDDQIRGAALQALSSDPDVPEDRIDVSVDAGWLTLKGEVKHQSDSNAAFEVATRIPGVGGITNKIEVVTAGR
ncbi:MAG TPA: BON domain-containing protein [Solirubrobacteraceae bacterium]|nr:BON domain-containing protein [Solirubrobacteraceae bacterium]